MKKYYLLLVLLIFVSGCINSVGEKFGKEKLELQIKDKINSLNYCNVDNDCITHSFGCPFGCDSPINKNADLNEVNGLITLYNGMNGEVCIYDCIQPEPLKCVQSRCVVK